MRETGASRLFANVCVMQILFLKNRPCRGRLCWKYAERFLVAGKRLKAGFASSDDEADAVAVDPGRVVHEFTD